MKEQLKLNVLVGLRKKDPSVSSVENYCLARVVENPYITASMLSQHIAMDSGVAVIERTALNWLRQAKLRFNADQRTSTWSRNV